MLEKCGIRKKKYCCLSVVPSIECQVLLEGADTTIYTHTLSFVNFLKRFFFNTFILWNNKVVMYYCNPCDVM
jgi:protein associated with RNAse G/E